MVKMMPRQSFDSSNRTTNSSKILAAPISLYNSLFLKAMSYHKLPEQLLKLSVLKLDGSSFCVSVARNACVADIKRAIEEVFEFSSEGQCKIMWSLVWAHFCLCYEGQKLISDKACIRFFGIRDGDQLQFVQHLTIDHKPAIKPSDNDSIINRSSMSTSEVAKRNNQINTEDQENELSSYHCGQEEAINMQQFKLAQHLKGWLSHSKLWGSTRKVLRGISSPSRFSLQCATRGPGLTT